MLAGLARQRLLFLLKVSALVLVQVLAATVVELAQVRDQYGSLPADMGRLLVTSTRGFGGTEREC